MIPSWAENQNAFSSTAAPAAIGGAYFQMWQIPAGAAVLENAFWFSAQLGIILLVVNAPDA